MKFDQSPHQKRKLLLYFSLGLLISLALIFIASRFAPFLLGPKVTILEPNTLFLSTEEPVLILKGQAKRVAKISINDRNILTDKDGFFAETLLLPPGRSIIALKAEDRFKHRLEKSINIIRFTSI